MARFPLLALLLLAACPRAGAPDRPDAPTFPVRQPPGPLEAREFRLPETESFTLGNGLRVVVATNDEVPLWGMRLVFRTGGFLDPEGKEGLASVTFDMLTKGAGTLSSEEIGRRLKQLASSLHAGADDDGAWIAVDGITRNLEPTLDLFEMVLERPTFPADEWRILQRRRVADVAAARKNPTAIAGRLFDRVLYGADYRGRLTTEASYGSVAPADMRDFYRRHVGPENAILLVGGDVDAATLRPLLERRLGDWRPRRIERPSPKAALATPERPVLYLHHFPGAAQSVIQLGTPVPQRTAPDHVDLHLANEAFGGAFTSRVNMNLREDKGYTYGARCGVSGSRYGEALWSCHTSVRTDATVASLREIQRELAEVLADRPLTEDEIAYFRSSETLGYPGRFETTGTILREQSTIWQYGLPDDWTVRWLDHIGAVTAEGANAALRRHLDPQRMVWLVVGDREAVGPELEALGLTVVAIDADGNVLTES